MNNAMMITMTMEMAVQKIAKSKMASTAGQRIQMLVRKISVSVIRNLFRLNGLIIGVLSVSSLVLLLFIAKIMLKRNLMMVKNSVNRFYSLILIQSLGINILAF